jgi:DNA-binding response OmpR family regulator
MPTLLLVEDNNLNREMFSRRLERKGFRVLGAADGREAVAKAQSERPDLVLMDLSLPIVDGWEATRRLKANPATQHLPVIALTAHAMVGDREKALQAGCDDYETKPVDLARLLGKINALLRSDAGRPAARTQAPRPTPTTHPAAPQAGGPAILVVDDNQLNRDMLSRRLQREGYEVLLARDGREALACLDRADCDLVLLDMMMPQMNGLEVLARIRATRSLVELPVVVVTAKGQSEDMVAALNLGANDYVTKPFEFPVLLARVQNHLLVRRNSRPALAAAAASAPGRRPDGPQDLPRRGRPDDTAGGMTEAGSTAGPLTPVPVGERAGGSTHDRPLTRARSEPVPAAPARGPAVQTLAGYEVLGEIGRGGMGVVYKARHVRMNRLVALKVINKEHLGGARTIQRFYREIQAAAQLSHPNIVMAFDAGQYEDTHYFAMEYVEGVDLSRLVRQHGPLPVKHACSFVTQAARGLQHAYERGLVHRDVKPSNLFVACSGEGGSLPPLDRSVVKILDLGLALLYETGEPSEAASGLTRDGRVVGTADYMAPEQWMNAHKVDVRADLYALGGTFYYLLTGQPPFPGAEPMEKMLKHHLDEPTPVEKRRPEVPALVLATVRRLMAKKPDQRFQQPSEVVEALKAIQPLGQ